MFCYVTIWVDKFLSGLQNVRACLWSTSFHLNGLHYNLEDLIMEASRKDINQLYLSFKIYINCIFSRIFHLSARIIRNIDATVSSVLSDYYGNHLLHSFFFLWTLVKFVFFISIVYFCRYIYNIYLCHILWFSECIRRWIAYLCNICEYFLNWFLLYFSW